LSTEQAATRALRGVILILMVLVPLAAIYSLLAAGVVGRPDFGGAGIAVDRGPVTLRLPPPGLQDRFYKTNCSEAKGVRTCTTMERPMKAGELPPPDAAPDLHPPPPGVPGPRAGFERMGFGVADETFQARIPGPGVAGGDVIFAGRSPFWPLERLAGAASLTTLWVILFLSVLYNLERLLRTLEHGSIFSPQTVRRLQLVGLCVMGLAFLPQLDIVALLFNIGVSLVRLESAPPLSVAFPGEVNIALLLAGAFTVLIARIVGEAARLADEIDGTV
jgi:hypothetical protein